MNRGAFFSSPSSTDGSLAFDSSFDSPILTSVHNQIHAEDTIMVYEELHKVDLHASAFVTSLFNGFQC